RRPWRRRTTKKPSRNSSRPWPRSRASSCSPLLRLARTPASAYPLSMSRTAAALVIGNEILTGKVLEQNIPVMAKEFFALGVELRRVVICPDEIPVIVRDVRELSGTHDLVITSGGVGPTHDDVTIKAVAQAFDAPVVRAPTYE